MKSKITSIFKRIHIIIPTILLVLFSVTKNIQSPYDRTIASDVVGYYAYLPALLIYNDLHFNFAEEISKKYYVDGRAGKYEFINYYHEKPVNKYWIGLSILWLPFFLLAHFLSYLFGFDCDGYSLLYQYSIGLAGSFYLAIGVFYFKKGLQFFNYSSIVNLVTIISVTFGTNLFYYAVVEPGHSHIYSFSFFSVFLWLLIKLKQAKSINLKLLFPLIVTATIVVFIRPLNVFLLLISTLFILELKGINTLLKSIFSNQKFLLIVIVPLIFIFIQLFLWHKQTGFWFVDSYAGESFNLSNPHLYQFLFSFKKGWLLYTPICAFSIVGIILYYRNKVSSLIIAFVILFCWVYLLSSWWIWTYGTSFGQRLMIDTYPILGIFLLIFIGWFYSKSRIATILICGLFCVLSVFQTWQQKNGVLPSYFVTKDIYSQCFLSKQKHAYALFSEDMVIDRQLKNFTIQENRYIFSKVTNNSIETAVLKDVPFSATLKDTIPEKFLYGVTKIKFEAKLNANDVLTNAAIVLVITRKDSTLNYNLFNIKDYVDVHSFVNMQFLIDLPNNLIYGDELVAYLYNPNAASDVIKMKDVSVEYLKLLKHE